MIITEEERIEENNRAADKFLKNYLQRPILQPEDKFKDAENVNATEMLSALRKKILLLDFDGVLHSYSTPWREADFIPDPPVPGAMKFLREALEHFDIMIFSSRSTVPRGIHAMQIWLKHWARKELNETDSSWIISLICDNPNAWPISKPPAHLTIDDRGYTFTGTFPSIQEIKDFKPWNK